MTTAASIPGYVAGTWDIDPVHSDISITAKHFGVSKVRGHFADYSGEIVTGEAPLDSKVTATIQATSIDTKNGDRDNHIRSADFLDVENYPTITFTSTGIEGDGEDFTLNGDLTLHGTTKPISLALELSGFGPDPYGGQRVGFSAKTKLSRKDFGIAFNAVLETGSLVVSDNLDVSLEIEAVLRAS
ncbi:MAG TPA: YceI family protein [Pseudonocardiaceae bacterium]|jgi:polyisoprenoid-binding protein YceI|nr:YceI family protein [Pseudonocardiaceae bacterium]